MFVHARRQKIRELVRQYGNVKVSDLVRQFGISEETARRDLNQLEIEGLVKKNYGGATLREEASGSAETVLPVKQRQSLRFSEKETIGRAAARLVKDHQVVILDAGTTTLALARHLRAVKDLTVVTNGLNVAEECIRNAASVFVVGGKLVEKSMSLIGPKTQNELLNFNAHYVFLGTSGVSLRKGFTSSDLFEAEVKRAMVSAAEKVVIVADHSKFGLQGVISFASFEEVDMLFTDDQAPERELKQIESMGVEIVVCSAGDIAQANEREGTADYGA
ncbi:DeoR/GlpR family DNA-binding transcription regulator [Gordoniibacillus kamchatkensis]|uniref:DeoR/GlpR family DNA-binding transcription regulator n=1 Tax=Gordoniibacillus kamchatkensis TaxID=1590651 RepID=UPI000698A0AE|nr:DeoR/GlpR family DNA-binding transcription regulator [Paenibacillus sp. VKM B-2647]